MMADDDDYVPNPRDLKSPRSTCHELNSAFYDRRGGRSSKFIVYEELGRHPSSWSIQTDCKQPKVKHLTHPARIDLAKWFSDTRPSLEHAVFVRLQDINITVSMNIPRKFRKRKTRLEQLPHAKSLTSASAHDWSIFSVRPSMMHFDPEKTESHLSLSRKPSVLGKALDRYQKEEEKQKIFHKALKKKLATKSLEEEAKRLDKLSITDVLDLEPDDGEKKGRVQFRIQENQSLYETLMDLGKLNGEAETTSKFSTKGHAKENVADRQKFKKEVKISSDRKWSKPVPKSVLKTRTDNTNTSKNSESGKRNYSATSR